MMYKKTHRSQEFFTTRGNYSTRVSARGYGILQPLLLEPDCTVAVAIQRQINQVKALFHSLPSADEKTKPEILCQLNRLRGQLGAWRGEFHNQEHWPTERLFMNVARNVLNADAFEFILSEVRALRESQAEFLWTQIEECLKTTKTSAQSALREITQA